MALVEPYRIVLALRPTIARPELPDVREALSVLLTDHGWPPWFRGDDCATFAWVHPYPARGDGRRLGRAEVFANGRGARLREAIGGAHVLVLGREALWLLTGIRLRSYTGAQNFWVVPALSSRSSPAERARQASSINAWVETARERSQANG